MRKCILILAVTAIVIGTAACAEAPLTRETDEVIDGNYVVESMADTPETVELLPMIYVQGRLYRLFSEQREPMGDSGSVTGHIQSTVGQDETPAEEGQSNFGEVGNPYCLDEEQGELVAMINDEWLRFTAVNLEVRPVDLNSLSKPVDLWGTDGIELNYIGDRIIVFHSFAGIFVCERTEDGWVLGQTLDLSPLEADATQGDGFTMVKADGQEVRISPNCYAPDNEIPVTYRYLISENRLELAGRFQEEEDANLKWSYSDATMARKETIYNKLGQEGILISNLYRPDLDSVKQMDSEVYGFIAVGSGDGEAISLQYGCYWEAAGRLELELIK